jgi:tripartite-type tricarboxylate transporter receptor subunit TctC
VLAPLLQKPFTIAKAYQHDEYQQCRSRQLLEDGMLCRAMQISIRSIVASAMSVMAFLLSAASAPDESVADFYKGKSINLIIASAEGGGYDISGRLIAAHLSKYIPGHPVVIPRNMAGASGMQAADYMYNVAAQDGTVICIPQPTMILNKVVEPSARYEPQAFGWIGRLASLQTIGVVWHTAPVQTVEAAKKGPLIMAAAQGNGSGANVLTALNRLVGTKFTMVKGYKSVSESGLAMERGEVQGISSTSWEYVESKGWIKQKDIGFLYIIGSERNPKIPDTPTINELASNNADRDVMRSISSAADIGRAILTPPNVPADRMEALRDAFASMLRDPDFIREAARRSLEVEPLAGNALQQVVRQAMDVTPDVAERTRRAIRE